MRLRLLLATCIIALPCPVWAQSGGSGGDGPRSTKSGVYTARQAAQGGELYGFRCVSCHPPATHTGPAFAAKWEGRPLSELYQYIAETMPKADPGSLSPEEYTLVLAYLLKMNGMPAGHGELSSNLPAMEKIRIAFKSTRDSTAR